MRYLIICMVLLLVVGIVSASTDCASYFTKTASKRDKMVNAFSSLVASTDRLSNEGDDFYNALDDMHSSDNLTDASTYFSDFVGDKNDVADDVSTLKDGASAYNSALRDDYSDLPSACRSMYYSYSDDYDNMNSYYRHIKSNYDSFITKYNVIYGYYDNLDNHHVSDIKTYVDNIRDYISKISSDANDASDLITQDNFENVSTKVYNQSECYQFVAASMDTVKAQMTSLCKRQIANVTSNCNTVVSNVTCPVCPATQNCDSLVRTVQNEYSQCQVQVSDLQTRISSMGSTNQGGTQVADCSAVSSQNTQLQKQIQDANALNANLTAENTKLQKSATCAVCQSCLIYEVIAVGLFLLILAAWIFAL